MRLLFFYYFSLSSCTPEKIINCAKIYMYLAASRQTLKILLALFSNPFKDDDVFIHTWLILNRNSLINR